ncbi:hydroxyacylglutathione hydrolase [Delftia tsuruhatensis]|uniref:MBL fold metallo-hydrolase n=1 Tax=Delftia tsuruhatensis TaxID=180282 RepID=UPI001E746562|nr:MBL fold metallo-hydrolase [Delftia tsuruhatensis]CAB5710840.1 hydroxyacylglutathione hydrolase [Delftia tsuruhatensis]CAC9692281.1 hydroxyacylglutathione hydrolase [Delftia tsuruhatensis]
MNDLPACTAPAALPLGMTVLERGWLSANNIVFAAAPDDPHDAGAAVVDTGYVSHAQQTVLLIEQTLAGQPLARILNTHLHSDHCGGNAALQARWPRAATYTAPGQAAFVRDWNPDALSYTPTGQECPRFTLTGVLRPGSSLRLSGRDWQIHAAPGHDPHSIILFEPASGTLISADALWENGFGVVFPEIEGLGAFDEVAATLDVIEGLTPRIVVPGHGGVFTDVATALDTARRRLDGFVRAPERHALYAAKVLLKYRLLDWQRVREAELRSWLAATPYFGMLHAGYFHQEPIQDWVGTLLEALVQSGAARRDGGWVLNA